MDEEASPYLRYFDLSGTGFAWQQPLPDQIVRRRADMNDKFIFDILLTSGGIEKPDTLFPPRDVDDLVELLRAIEDSAYDILKKECLVYYLLKWHRDGREERLQLERSIPPQFAALADAYWHLDAGVNIPRAISILSDNRLNREYASKIIHAISICPTPAPLIVQYVRTAKPLLTAPQDVWTYTLALAESSLLEAWQFQRTFGETEELRTQLLEKILEWSISPSPRPKAFAILLSLPLSRFEEEFLHKYALEPPKSLSLKSIATLRDLICVRLIQSGKYTEAVKADHQFAASTLNESKTHAVERRKMVKELYEALPLADRTLLDAELEGTDPLKPILVQASVPPPKATPAKTGINGDASMSLSQSWEEVPRTLPSLTNGRAPPPRAAAPLFGGPQLGASTSSATAPLIPITTTAVLTSSQSFPLSSSLSSSTAAKPRMSLGSHKQPFFPGASTGSKGKPLQFDFQPSTSTSSASRKPNAFYTPPVQQQNGGPKRPFDDLAASTGSRKSVNIDHREDADADMEVDTTPKKGKLQQEHESEDEDEEPEREQQHGQGERERELGFSIFGNGPTAPKPVQTKSASTKTSRSSRPSATVAPSPEPKQSRRAPPGAFHVSDEEDEQEEHTEEEPISAPAPEPVSARTRRSTRTPAELRSKRTKRTAREKEVDLGRSLPGSLMDEDRDGEEEEDDEAEDHVAPLREPSPPARRVRLSARRSTTSSDFGDEDDGSAVKTRRRSTRLSIAGSPPQRRATELKAEKGEKTSVGATKVRKSTRAAGATKKKR